MLNLKKFKTKILKIKIKVTSFQTCPRPYVINTWFKFEDKIQNLSKVIVFTRNQTDDADDDGTITICLLRSGGDIITEGLQTNILVILLDRN